MMWWADGYLVAWDEDDGGCGGELIQYEWRVS